MSLFEQTQLEVDQKFYATFPGARNAAYIAPHSLQYDIRNELDISSTSVSFTGPTQELSYPQFPIHPQQTFISYHQSQSSCYSPPRPVSFFLTFPFVSSIFNNDLLD
jgi:hypothetical protein